MVFEGSVAYRGVLGPNVPTRPAGSGAAGIDACSGSGELLQPAVGNCQLVGDGRGSVSSGKFVANLCKFVANLLHTDQ